LLIKYIKSVLWRVVKRLSYIQDARCLKVKLNFPFSFLLSLMYKFALQSTGVRIYQASRIKLFYHV